MRMGEQFIVHVGPTDVLVTAKRVKNVNLRIGSDGQAHMSVPAHMTRAEAERVALRHEAWFAENTAHAKKRRAERQRFEPVDYVTGEHIMVWGRPTTLRVVGADETQVPCELVGDELVVRDGGSPSWRATALEQWLQQQLLERLDELFLDCTMAVGAIPTKVTVRRMKTRWGSCTPSNGRIRMNTALAECPPECTRMVLVHELCHLHVRNHGAQFQALMDLHAPGWRVTQRWLDEHSPRVP